MGELKNIIGKPGNREKAGRSIHFASNIQTLINGGSDFSFILNEKWANGVFENSLGEDLLGGRQARNTTFEKIFLSVSVAGTKTGTIDSYKLGFYSRQQSSTGSFEVNSETPKIEFDIVPGEYFTKSLSGIYTNGSISSGGILSAGKEWIKTMYPSFLFTDTGTGGGTVTMRTNIIVDVIL